MTQLSKCEKQESLEVLNYQIRACTNCVLSTSRKYALTGEGNIDAQIMFIALSPGRKENEANKMFIGPSGKVFNKLLVEAGIDRDSVFMTNLVKCMLPKNRKPNADEIEACSQFLNDEILIVNPQTIVPLGTFATNAVLMKYHFDPQSPAMHFRRINGHFLSVHNTKIFPLPHPAVLLYNPTFLPSTIEKYKMLKASINHDNKPNLSKPKKQS